MSTWVEIQKRSPSFRFVSFSCFSVNGHFSYLRISLLPLDIRLIGTHDLDTPIRCGSDLDRTDPVPVLGILVARYAGVDIHHGDARNVLFKLLPAFFLYLVTMNHRCYSHLIQIPTDQRTVFLVVRFRRQSQKRMLDPAVIAFSKHRFASFG
ncbi:MAG: hypothetical protein QG664_53 [Patescibacteria group bacterium]|nr:hypothetical protein [Patescibacteria group bacterium]